MKYNLIFSGIPEGEDRQVEHCETTIKNFINKDFGAEGDVEFQNVHRLRQRVDRKPRNIIVKFTKYTDHEKVPTAAFEKGKGRKDFAVFQQYPAEISARRKELIPQVHALKREGRQGVRLVIDKLYVGNHLVNQHPHPPNQQRRQDGTTGTHLSQAPVGPPKAQLHRPLYRRVNNSCRHIVREDKDSVTIQYQ
jgi:hypothetical protein